MVTTKLSSVSGPRPFPNHEYASCAVSIVCIAALVNSLEPLCRPMRPSISLACSCACAPESVCWAWKMLKILSSSAPPPSAGKLKCLYASERSRRLTRPLLSSIVVLICNSSELRCFAMAWMHS